MSNNSPVITDSGFVWRYEVPERTDAKVQLLTTGAVATYGHWVGKYGEFFVAYCPLPKRDRAKEKELGVLGPHARTLV